MTAMIILIGLSVVALGLAYYIARDLWRQRLEPESSSDEESTSGSSYALTEANIIGERRIFLWGFAGSCIGIILLTLAYAVILPTWPTVRHYDIRLPVFLAYLLLIVHFGRALHLHWSLSWVVYPLCVLIPYGLPLGQLGLALVLTLWIIVYLMLYLHADRALERLKAEPDRPLEKGESDGTTRCRKG